MSDINETLDERAKTYGTFESNAKVAQQLKAALHHALSARDESSYGDFYIAPDQVEALQMICSKLARIVNGDPNHVDSWRDIAGYAQLVADRLNGVVR